MKWVGIAFASLIFLAVIFSILDPEARADRAWRKERAARRIEEERLGKIEDARMAPIYAKRVAEEQARKRRVAARKQAEFDSKRRVAARKKAELDRYMDERNAHVARAYARAIAYEVADRAKQNRIKKRLYENKYPDTKAGEQRWTDDIWDKEDKQYRKDMERISQEYPY